VCSSTRDVVTADAGGICPDAEGKVTTVRARAKESRTTNGEGIADTTLPAPAARARSTLGLHAA